MRHRSLHLLVVGLVSAVTVGLLPAPTAHAGTRPKLPDAGRVTFGLQPATGGKPDARPTYRYSVTPGGRLTDQVAIRNLSDIPATFSVYATDAVNVENGGFGLLTRAQHPVDVGAWLSVGDRGFTGSVTVKPRSNVILPVRLAVPAKAQPGDHTGGIVVSLATRSRKGTTDVVLDQRVGARVFIRVSGPQRPALTVKPVDAAYQGTWNPFGLGRSIVRYTVTNTGNINLGGRQRVVVRGLFGPSRRSNAIVDLGLLLPGGSAAFTTTVPKTLPFIRGRAQVSISPLVQVGDQVNGLQTYTARATFWAVPWALLGLLVALGAVGWVVRRRRHRRRRAPAETEPIQLGERRAKRVATSTTLAVAAVVAFPGLAHAQDAPYTDPGVQGGITLCDSHGRVVTSGAMNAQIATTAVGGARGQAPYDGAGRSAILLAIQPRQGVTPGEWNGKLLTALSRYDDPAHPTVEILPRDSTLRGFVDAYPADWNGLVQLRIYLRAPQTPTNTSSYSATTVQVSGDRWQQLGPDAGNVCASRAVSVIRLLNLPTAVPTPKPTQEPTSTASAATASPPPTPSSPPTSPPTSGAGATPRPIATAQPPESSSTPVATAAPGVAAVGRTQSTGSTTVRSLAAVALLLAVGAAVWLSGRNRRHRPDSPR